MYSEIVVDWMSGLYSKLKLVPFTSNHTPASCQSHKIWNTFKICIEKRDKKKKIKKKSKKTIYNSKN